MNRVNRKIGLEWVEIMVNTLDNNSKNSCARKEQSLLFDLFRYLIRAVTSRIFLYKKTDFP